MEIWRPVVGYEGFYEVSHQGRVRRIGSAPGAKIGRILKQTPNKNTRYLSVMLHKNGTAKRRGVHGLVCQAFHGRQPLGKFPNHKDLNRQNNTVDNLEWLTKKENAQHAIALGVIWGRGPVPGTIKHPPGAHAGTRNSRAKLNWELVSQIRELKGKLGARRIAAQFGVSRSAVRFIHQNKHWILEER